MLSGRGLCDELITRPEESYRLWCVVVCDLETSGMGAPYIYDISSLRVKDITVFSCVSYNLLCGFNSVIRKFFSEIFLGAFQQDIVCYVFTIDCIKSEKPYL